MGVGNAAARLRRGAPAWERFALSRWRGWLIGAGALGIGAAIWLHAAGPGTGAGYDFGAYLSGAKDVLAGRDPYSHLLSQVNDMRSGDTGVHARGYVYPPLLALLLSLPLRLGLDTTALWLVWNLLSVAAVLWMARELNQTLRGSRGWPATLGFAAAIMLPAFVTYDLFLGQADVLMAALAVGACGLWLRGNRWAALPIGLAIAVKPTLALVLLAWLWMGDWRAALRGAGVALALLLAPFVPLGLNTLRDYVVFYTRWNAFNANAEQINQSPVGFLLRALTPNPYTRPIMDAPALVTPLRILIIVAALACYAWAVPRGRTRSMRLGMGACLLALPLILLLSPLAEDIHFCLIVPALVGLGWLALDAEARWWHSRGHGATPDIHAAVWLGIPLLYLVCCIPRIQEIVYPDHLLALPGQGDAALGPLIVLLRSGVLCAIAVLTLVAGARLLRHLRRVTHAGVAGPDDVPRDYELTATSVTS
ncbi:MAG: glycosyltransferase family 87 protein [Ktedonobacterales bacterium]